MTEHLCLCGHDRGFHQDPSLELVTVKVEGCLGGGVQQGVRLCRCQGFVEAWASGYLIEFTDDGPPERFVIRISDEATAERTSRTLEGLSALPYGGERPVLYGTVFFCTQASLGPAGIVSALWADGPKAAIRRLSEPKEDNDP